METLQPLAVRHVGPAAGHVLKIPGVDQTYFQTGSLQNLERRYPIDAGGFHRYGLNPALVKPRGKRVQLPGESAKGSHRLRVAIHGNGGKNLVGSNVQSRGVRIQNRNPFWLGAPAGPLRLAFSRHGKITST